MQGSALTPVPLRHGERSRPYLLQVPPDLGGPLPLVVELHGRGTDPVRFDRYTGLSGLAAARGFVLALPGAVGGIWNDGRNARRSDPDDCAYLVALLDDVAARVAIDATRVYVVGMSNGAAMTGRMAVEHGNRLAAVAQVAGTAAAALVSRRAPLTPVPLMQIHGTADQLVPYAGGVRRRLIGRRAIRTGGPSIGVEEWLALWAGVNGANGAPFQAQPAPDVTRRDWSGASPGNDVVGYRIEGGGHTWPGSRRAVPRWVLGRTSHGIDATAEIWQFFASRRRP